MFIFSIHAVNALLGCASFSWPHIPPSLDIMAWLKVCGKMGLLIVQGIVMASSISLVEELLFRSWLPQEIAVDLGYHYGIIISALAFSFLQRFVSSLCFSWYSCMYYPCMTLGVLLDHELPFLFFPKIFFVKISDFCVLSVFLFVLVHLFVPVKN